MFGTIDSYLIWKLTKGKMHATDATNASRTMIFNISTNTCMDIFYDIFNLIEKDEKEKNLRKILNFGHTFAHAYEASLNFSKKLNHGEAVILGMKSAFEFSHNKKLISQREFDSAFKHLNNSHFPISIKNYR